MVDQPSTGRIREIRLRQPRPRRPRSWRQPDTAATTRGSCREGCGESLADALSDALPVARRDPADGRQISAGWARGNRLRLPSPRRTRPWGRPAAEAPDCRGGGGVALLVASQSPLLLFFSNGMQGFYWNELHRYDNAKKGYR
jgi:hypothetical protein